MTVLFPAHYEAENTFSQVFAVKIYSVQLT